MANLPIPEKPDAITAKWLTAALQSTDTIGTASVSGDRVVWTLMMGREQDGPTETRVPVETVSGEVLFDFDRGALVIEDGGETVYADFHGASSFEADLAERMVTVLAPDGRELAVLELGAIDAMFERHWGGPVAGAQGAVLLTPDGDTFGIQVLGPGPVMAIGSFGDAVLVAQSVEEGSAIHVATWPKG